METEEYNFLNLLKNYDIVFPIIQRDYAQGRKSAHPTEVRQQFVEELCNVLSASGSSAQLQLDFVFGTIKKPKDNNSKPTFIPLDGQQRLTTLFLLHWYVFYLDSVNNFGLQREDIKVCFSYETRDYAKEFCERMCECFAKDGNTKFPVLDKNRKISEIIKDQNWFQAIWEEDPTVKGMLVMLNAIEDELNFLRILSISFKKKLNNITFYVLPLEENFALADDLYVKMNARGLGLTNFENFKASLIKQIDETKSNYAQNFKDNIDRKWTNLFWKTTKDAKQKPVASADDEMIRFVRMILSFRYALRSDKFSQDVEKTFRAILVNASGKNAIPAEQFTYFKLHNELDVLNKDDVDFLIKAFEQIGSLFDNDGVLIKGRHPIIQNGYYDTNKKLNHFVDVYAELKEFVSNEKPDYDNQLMILGIIYASQIRKHKNQWLRLVRNLIRNTITDSQQKMFDAIKGLNKLKDNFIKCASNNSWDTLFNNTTHFSSQGEEEIAKFKIILKHSSCGIEKKIFEYENCDYLEGRIRFLLLWSNCSSDLKNISRFNCNDFTKYGDKILSLFKIEDSTPYFIERLLLSTQLKSKGKYVYPYQYEDWKLPIDYLVIQNGKKSIQLQKGDTLQQYSFANLKNDRDYSWKRLLNDNPDDFKDKTGKRTQRGESLLDCQELFEQICATSLWSIPIQPKTGTLWRDTLIKNKKSRVNLKGISPIKYCTKSVLYIYRDNNKEHVFLSQQGIGKIHYKSSNPRDL